VKEKTKKDKKNYSDEFRVEAVKLASRIGNLKAADELGVHVTSIRKWRSSTEVSTNSGQSLSEIEKENKKLRKENEYLREINKVLKKSTAIFSQDQIGLKK
jgi:transposase